MDVLNAVFFSLMEWYFLQIIIAKLLVGFNPRLKCK